MRNAISANMAHVVFFGVLACAVLVVSQLDNGSSHRADLAPLPNVQSESSN